MSSAPLTPEVEEPGDGVARDPYAEGWAALNKLLRRGYSWSGRERNAVFLSCGPGARFAGAGAVAGLDLLDDGRAVAAVDWDLDGDTDLVTTARTGPRVRVLENRLGPRASRVALLPVDGRGVPVVGARVELAPGADAPPLVRSVRAGEGYLAQSSAWLPFAWEDGRARASAPRAGDPLDVLVHWPFAARPERFAGVEAGGSFRLPRGAGRAERWTPPEGGARAPVREARPPAPPAGTRVVMSAPVPLPRLTVESARGGEVELFGIEPGGAGRGTGRPILLHLWASWCAPCVRELDELAERSAELAASGVAFLALSVEQGEERAAAHELMERLEWPFAWGFLTPDGAEVLDALAALLLDRERRLPVPASFLVDAEGRLRVLRFGPVTPEDVARDAALLEVDPAEQHRFATPFAGRWRSPPGPSDPAFFEGRLRARGLDEAAREYGRARIRVAESSPAAVLHAFGRRAAEAGDVEGALRWLLQATERDPDFFEARFDLGVLLQREGRVADAATAYGQALRLRPDDVDTHFNLGLAYLVLGDEEAVRGEIAWLDERRPALADVLREELGKKR